MDQKKKNIILGSVAGVILLIAGILIIRGLFAGGSPEPVTNQEQTETVSPIVDSLKEANPPQPEEEAPPNAKPRTASPAD